jgi:ethanolamine transporter EutH
MTTTAAKMQPVISAWLLGMILRGMVGLTVVTGAAAHQMSSIFLDPQSRDACEENCSILFAGSFLIASLLYDFCTMPYDAIGAILRVFQLFWRPYPP